MGTFIVDSVAIILGIVGLIGCILPMLPGPPLSYAGLLLLYIYGMNTGEGEITSRFMVIWLVATVAVTALDYVVPAFFTRVTGGSKEAVRFSVLGMIIGIVFFPPFGMLAGAFLGALIAELTVKGKDLGQSLKAALGSFLGFLLGTGLKLAASGIMMYYIIKYIII